MNNFPPTKIRGSALWRLIVPQWVKTTPLPFKIKGQFSNTSLPRSHNMHATYPTAQLLPFASFSWPQISYLPGLHLLRPSTEGHVGVAGARAIPLLLLHVGDEGATLAGFPLAAPVVEHFLDQLVVLLQQQLGLLETDELRRDPSRCKRSEPQNCDNKFNKHIRVLHV